MIEWPVDQRTITRRYTDQAIQFVEAHQDEPFSCTLPHSMPHIPLYVPEDALRSRSGQRLHLRDRTHRCRNRQADESRARIGIRPNSTYVVFTTDNGPWLQFKNHGGSAKPLRAGKGTTFEGGQRVPCIMWAPGRIPAGTSTNAMASTMDLLPTIAAITESKLP